MLLLVNISYWPRVMYLQLAGQQLLIDDKRGTTKFSDPEKKGQGHAHSRSTASFSLGINGRCQPPSFTRLL
jgi:hypothetical protein